MHQIIEKSVKMPSDILTKSKKPLDPYTKLYRFCLLNALGMSDIYSICMYSSTKPLTNGRFAL